MVCYRLHYDEGFETMATKKVRKKAASDPAKELEPLAYTVKEFCKVVGISPRTFYTLRETRKAPPIIHIGRRTLIRVEAAQKWLKNREVTA